MNTPLKRILIGLVLTTTLSMTGCASRRTTGYSITMTTVDLRAYYDLRATNSSQFGAWEVVPKGKQTFEGTLFDVDGMIRLFGTKQPPHGTTYRDRVEGIKIGQKIDRLHLLHGTGWSGTNGMPVAQMVWHYTDGTQRSFPIVYGEHVRDWWWRGDSDEVTDPDSDVVWKGDAPQTTVRLFRTTFCNPQPEKKVATLDLVSARSLVTPAIVAITITVEGR